MSGISREGDCIIAGCAKPRWTRGWCCSHYERWRKHGDPLAGRSPVNRPAAERFWTKVVAQGECWVWAGARKPNGYGRFGADRKTHYAHRWAFEYMVGPIPDGLDLDHLCRNRACVNPEHLDPVTRRENLNRGTHHRRYVSGEDLVRNPWAKRLAAADVLEIRASLDSNRAIADRYSVSISNIEHIKARRSWAWVA